MDGKGTSNGVAVRFDRPPVHVSGNGVLSVNPADILRSSVGQAEIREAAADARVRATNPNGPAK